MITIAEFARRQTLKIDSVLRVSGVRAGVAGLPDDTATDAIIPVTPNIGETVAQFAARVITEQQCESYARPLHRCSIEIRISVEAPRV